MFSPFRAKNKIRQVIHRHYQQQLLPLPELIYRHQTQRPPFHNRLIQDSLTETLFSYLLLPSGLRRPHFLPLRYQELT